MVFSFANSRFIGAFCGFGAFGVALIVVSLCTAEPRLTTQQEYQQVVAPFLKTYCAGCHNPQEKKGELSLHALSAKVVKETNGDLWTLILDRIEQESMPPKEAQKQPGGQVRKQVVDWIRAEIGHAGIERDPDLLQRPEFGNLVSHQDLFSGRIQTPPYSTPRVWRMRAGLMKYGSPFPQERVDYAAMRVVDEPMTMRLRAMSERIADELIPYVLGEKTRHRNNRHNPRAVVVYRVPELVDPTLYTGQKTPSRGNLEADVTTLFRAFVSRKPTADEVSRYTDFLAGMLASETDRISCLATVMRAMIMTPEAVYRLELGLGEKLSDGRRMLSPEELAIAVPMSLGKSKAVPGLRTRADVERAVRELLKRDRHTNGPNKTPYGISPRFMDFMHQYFGYDRAPEVFKGDRLPKHHKGIGAGARAKQPPVHLVQETDQVVAQILRDDTDVFRRLLTTDSIYVSYRMDFYLAYYGFSPDDPSLEEEKFRGPFKSPVPRAGILMQPSWLQAHSTFTDNHVVLRGKWVREKLLGGSIPEVPVGVDAAIPDDEDKTLRERLQSTRGDFCWRCHRKMDPLGWPFEMYDDFGRYRANNKERLINGTYADGDVDTSGAILASEIPGLDGSVSDAVEMLHKIARTDRARQVFVRHVFRYFMGRNETLVDSQTLIAADRAYVESNGSFSELVVSILTSDSFLYRKEVSDSR